MVRSPGSRRRPGGARLQPRLRRSPPPRSVSPPNWRRRPPPPCSVSPPPRRRRSRRRVLAQQPRRPQSRSRTPRQLRPAANARRFTLQSRSCNRSPACRREEDEEEADLGVEREEDAPQELGEADFDEPSPYRPVSPSLSPQPRRSPLQSRFRHSPQRSEPSPMASEPPEPSQGSPPRRSPPRPVSPVWRESSAERPDRSPVPLLKPRSSHHGATRNGRRRRRERSAPRPKQELIPKEKPEGCRTVWVGWIEEKPEEEEIRQFFKDCGIVTEVRISERMVRGFFAHVQFEDTLNVDEAMKKSGETFKDQRIWLDYAYMDKAVTKSKTDQGHVNNRRYRPKSVKPQNGHTLWCGDISIEATEQDLLDLFEPCGKIEMICLQVNQLRNGQFGHMKFFETEAVDKAAELAGTLIKGVPIRLDYAEDKPLAAYRVGKERIVPESNKPEDCRTVWVGGLPNDATEDIVRTLFERCGEIKEIRLDRSRRSGTFFCHVEYEDSASVDKAIRLSGERLNCAKIRVDFAENRIRSKFRPHDVADGAGEAPHHEGPPNGHPYPPPHGLYPYGPPPPHYGPPPPYGHPPPPGWPWHPPPMHRPPYGMPPPPPGMFAPPPGHGPPVPVMPGGPGAPCPPALPPAAPPGNFQLLEDVGKPAAADGEDKDDEKSASASATQDERPPGAFMEGHQVPPPGAGQPRPPPHPQGPFAFYGPGPPPGYPGPAPPQPGWDPYLDYYRVSPLEVGMPPQPQAPVAAPRGRSKSAGSYSSYTYSYSCSPAREAA